MTQFRWRLHHPKCPLKLVITSLLTSQPPLKLAVTGPQSSTLTVIQAMTKHQLKALKPSWVLHCSYWHCTKHLFILFISEHLKKDWNAPIYAFFKPVPSIDHDNGRRFHEFTCGAKGCNKKIWHYLDKKDANSTGNLRKHAKKCWGAETVAAADQTKNAAEARSSVINLVSKNGSITAIFERLGRTKVTYSHRQHTKTEAKFVTSQ